MKKPIDGYTLLTRENFKIEVFKRDNGKCLFCEEKAVDAHHIMDRKLFSNGGYFLHNGGSLCSKHHLDAEQGRISCDEIRHAAGIRVVLLPPNYPPNEIYDKWGKVI